MSEPPIVQQPWLILGVLALALLKFVYSFPAKDARRELASDFMSLRLPMRQVPCGLVGSCCVTSLGLPVSRCPRTDISGKET